jgi:hypothetical protein
VSYLPLLIGAAVVAAIVLYVLLARSRAKAETNMSPEEIRRKRALEDLTDNLSP